jgi:hypothetical protein
VPVAEGPSRYISAKNRPDRGRASRCFVAATPRLPNCIIIRHSPAEPPLAPPFTAPCGPVQHFFQQWRAVCLYQQVGSICSSKRSSLGSSCKGRPWTVPPAGLARPQKPYPVPIRCAASAPDDHSSGAALAAGAAQRMGLLTTSRSAGCTESPLREEGCTLRSWRVQPFLLGRPRQPHLRRVRDRICGLLRRVMDSLRATVRDSTTKCMKSTKEAAGNRLSFVSFGTFVVQYPVRPFG